MTTPTNWRPIKSHDGSRTPVIIAVPDSDYSGWIVGEAFFWEGDWWWAGMNPEDGWSAPISETNHYLPQFWCHIPDPPANAPLSGQDQ